MRPVLARLLLAVLAALAVAAAPAGASPNLKLGVMDDALFRYRPELAWPWTFRLKPQILRFNLSWAATAPRRPAWPYDPDDPAYRFDATDRLVEHAAQLHIPVVLTITQTPAWAGGGKDRNHAPRDLDELEAFAYAAGIRYGVVVQRWTAWNEPNLPQGLSPQVRRVGGKLVRASPVIYAGILKAIYRGIHRAGRELGVRQWVAGGVTSPYGCGIRCGVPSIAPLTFLRDVHRLKAPFDAWAHHPYRIRPFETPTVGNHDPQVSFGNLRDLRRVLDRLYPVRKPPIWLTEMGYQTNPPDTHQGVSPAVQARYLRECVRIARTIPRVDMLIWFMLRDEEQGDRGVTAGFQTGLFWDSDLPKPSFYVFRELARGGR